MENSNKVLKRNAFLAMFYLVFVIVSQQWKFIVGLLVVTIIMIPLPSIIAGEGIYYQGVSMIALIMFLPSLFISLILMPTIQNQIGSSSIQKRLNASGISKQLQSFTLVLFISLLSLAILYLMVGMVWMIFNNASYTSYDYDLEKDVSTIWYKFSIELITMFIFAPIIIIGFTSTGSLISKIKINEIAKGVIVFLFIIFAVILFSRTFFQPLDWFYDKDQIGKLVKYNKIMFWNPWGTMYYTISHMIGGNPLGIIGDYTSPDVASWLSQNVNNSFEIVHASDDTISTLVSMNVKQIDIKFSYLYSTITSAILLGINLAI